MVTRLSLPTPPGFSFRSTVYSHGWAELLPFQLDIETWTLAYVFTDGAGRTASGVISEGKGRINVLLSSVDVDKDKVRGDVRHILRLDDDLSGFYDLLSRHEHLRWVETKAAGRLLRSPTVWEDLVKTMCTTNCSWALTKIMVRNLVEKLGKAAPSGSVHAFPTAAAMAGEGEAFYRSEIKAGYRSPYFLELADAVASGRFDPESWLNSPLSGPELRKEMKKIKGIGDYAADNLLKLVGKYDGLALDSWLRSQFYKKYNNAKPCKDSKIERHYKKYGDWRGLVIWCDMTEKWIA